MRLTNQSFFGQSAHNFPVNMSAAADEKQHRISATIDSKTIGFMYVDPNQMGPFSNIRKVRETQLHKVMASLETNGWDSSYNILAMEMVPEVGTPEAKTYPSSLEMLSCLDEEEVRPAFCMY